MDVLEVRKEGGRVSSMGWCARYLCGLLRDEWQLWFHELKQNCTTLQNVRNCRRQFSGSWICLLQNAFGCLHYMTIDKPVGTGPASKHWPSFWSTVLVTLPFDWRIEEIRSVLLQKQIGCWLWSRWLIPSIVWSNALVYEAVHWCRDPSKSINQIS